MAEPAPRPVHLEVWDYTVEPPRLVDVLALDGILPVDAADLFRYREDAESPLARYRRRYDRIDWTR